jgi:hypothetical protein
LRFFLSHGGSISNARHGIRADRHLFQSWLDLSPQPICRSTISSLSSALFADFSTLQTPMLCPLYNDRVWLNWAGFPFTFVSAALRCGRCRLPWLQIRQFPICRATNRCLKSGDRLREHADISDTPPSPARTAAANDPNGSPRPRRTRSWERSGRSRSRDPPRGTRATRPRAEARTKSWVNVSGDWPPAQIAEKDGAAQGVEVAVQVLYAERLKQFWEGLVRWADNRRRSDINCLCFFFSELIKIMRLYQWE